MEEDSKMVKLMSPTAFAAEIILVFMGLCGISVVGVHIGFFHSLPFLFVVLGLSFGLVAVIISVTGVYVLLYLDYRRLKLYLTFLTLFLGFQLAFIIHLYFFTNNIDISDQQQGSIIALDVCFGLSASALIALCFQLQQKGSTIEMVKL